MPIVFFLAISCTAPPMETPDVLVSRTDFFPVPQNIRDKIDILFMVDNSASMEAMSQELRDRFPQFLQTFADLAAAGENTDLHIGVVTSDYGAGATGVPGACEPSPGGQRGRLQARGEAATGCLPPVGAKFIQYKFGGANNLPPGQDLARTFTCMASVGSRGCGFEHQLESVYAALKGAVAGGTIVENQGFLRDDAILAVVFLTNEDDSSAPTDAIMFDRNRSAAPPDGFGHEDSYRQTEFGIVCGDPPQLPPYGDSGGLLANCHAAPNPGLGSEFDISRYIQFFTKPRIDGGIKEDPLDVVLVGIDAPADKVQIILARLESTAALDYRSCAPLDEAGNPPCVPVLQHSCRSAAHPGFFGDPAVRLNEVIAAVRYHDVSSICADDYSATLKRVSGLIATRIRPGCIPGRLPRDKMGRLVANCTVEDWTHNPDGTTTTVRIPRCDDAGTFPCWRVEPKDGCVCHGDACAGGSPDGVGVTIDRHGQAAPPHTVAQVACDTLPN